MLKVAELSVLWLRHVGLCIIVPRHTQKLSWSFRAEMLLLDRVISRSIAEYLVQAWDVRNHCKHNGAVLPLPSAPEGRGADGVDAMA
jgi:hypothetical protein